MIKENPYQASRPIDDSKDFFGRKREFRFVYQMLMSNESVNIIGSRRIGKTSFLNVLPGNEIQHNFFGESIFNEKDIFLFLDMQSQKTTTPTEFLSRLAEQIHVNEIDINHKMQSYYDFEIVIERLTHEGIRIFILLDEFDSVAQNDQFDIEFYDMLRHYQQRYRVSYIVASTKGIKEVSKSTVTSSEFFGIFRVLRLGLLEEKDANDLICKDDSLSLHMKFVKLIAGYHPFFITQLCFYLFHFHLYEADTPIEKLREMSIYHFLEEAFDHFSYYWEHLSTEERAVLKKISKDKKITQDDAPELTALKQKALIIEENGKYMVFSSAFDGFVEEIKFSEMKEELSQFLTKNTKTLVSIAKYCVDKAIELKK
jgi:hypothetical protein